MSLTIDITDVTEVPMPQAGGFPARAEAAGFDGVGVRDNQATGRDSYLRLAMAAQATIKVNLFPAVSNPITRHPAVVASLMNSLSELAPGRARLVMGGGEGSVAHIGAPPATIAQVREGVGTIQRLLGGKSLGTEDSSHGGSHFMSDDGLPIYINAGSPRMLELAGEIGDGAMVMVGTHPGIVTLARERVQAGAQKAGRDTGDFDISMDTDLDAARRRARTTLFWWLRRPRRLFTSNTRELGLDLPLVTKPEDIPDAAVPTLCDSMGLVGTPEQCAEQLERLVESCDVGHVHLAVYGSQQQAEETFESLCKVVLPRVK
jgi:5,10-methylenetetrahydromethanopterin reductase